MNVWARVAIIAGLLGLLVANDFLPSWLQGLLLGAFLMAGPGAALCAWLPLPASTAAVVVPTLGTAAVILYGTYAVRTDGLDPLMSLAIASFVTVAAGLGRSVRDSRRVSRSAEAKQ